MIPIQAIVGIVKTIKDALGSGAAQNAQASQMMNLKGGDGQDDDNQVDDMSDGAAQASNTLMDREMSRIQAMLAQATGAGQNGTNSHGSGQ